MDFVLQRRWYKLFWPVTEARFRLTYGLMKESGSMRAATRIAPASDPEAAYAHTETPPTPEQAASKRLGALIARSALKDRAAFQELYRCTSRLLFNIALQRLRDQASAEEVLQDAFLEIWNKAGTYCPSAGKPMTWLITIVDNRSIDLVRRRTREGQLILRGEDALSDAERFGCNMAMAFDAFRDCFGADVMRRLQDCFQRLSVNQRRAITRIRIYGMTIDEAAVVFQVPRQTAAAWVRRGLERLSGCMGR
jgi:RNA polymerase sigma-70 factor, ECF subfamily